MKTHPTQPAAPAASEAPTAGPSEPSGDREDPNPTLRNAIAAAREDRRREEAVARMATREPLGLD